MSGPLFVADVDVWACSPHSSLRWVDLPQGTECAQQSREQVKDNRTRRAGLYYKQHLRLAHSSVLLFKVPEGQTGNRPEFGKTDDRGGRAIKQKCREKLKPSMPLLF